MTTFLAYVWTPVLMAVLALGLGLLLERVARVRLPSALLAPVGVASAIPLTTTIFQLHGTGMLAAVVIAAMAGVGHWLARRDLRTRFRPGWAGAAALVTGLLYIGPHLMTGGWSWGGYNFVNDTSVNMIYVDLLEHHGFTHLEGPYSTTTRMQAIGVDLHYPMGAHGLIAALWPLAGIDAAPLYQPFIAGIAAAAAAAMTQIARRGGAPGPVAALLGFLAASAHLVYRYGQHGAIKEIVMVMLVATAAALVAEALSQGLRAGFGALLGLCFASMLLVFSVAGAPYALLTAALAVVALLVGPRRASLRQLTGAAAALALTGIAATIAVLGDVVSFGQGAATTFESSGPNVVSTAQMGHLVSPLPAYQSVGVWLGEDYRLPLAPGGRLTLQTALIVIIVAAALVGLALQLRRRRFGAPLLLGVCGLTAILAAPRVAPYADAKLLVLASAPILLLGGLGVWELSRVRLPGAPVVAAALALACGGGILLSDAIAAHETRLAPTDRMEALEDAAERAGRGYWLVNEWEEFSKYFTRSIRNVSGSESESPDVVVLREDRPIFGKYFDLDDQALEFIHRFDGIVTRRNPVASLPPSDYRRSYANDYYELWRRDRGVQVREHLSLGSEYDAASTPSCKEVRALARRAERNGDVLLAAPRRPVPVLDVIGQRGRPLGWVPDRTRPGMVSLRTPGRLTGTLRGVPAARYRVWVQLSSGRPMQVSVDGQKVGSVGQVNTPDQWLEAGEVTLGRGDHRIELLRGGGRPLPGDGYNGELGPVALQPAGDEPPPRRVRPADAPQELCSRPWDWIEAVGR